MLLGKTLCTPSDSLPRLCVASHPEGIRNTPSGYVDFPLTLPKLVGDKMGFKLLYMIQLVANAGYEDCSIW